MTGRTHDLTAFVALTWALTIFPIPQISLSTAITALGFNILGGLTPDIDEPSSKFWSNIPAGTILGRIIHPLLGSHRMISHSLFGIVIIGWLLNLLLTNISSVLLVDMNVVWWSFMLGFLSHLIIDTFTKEGVPWLFPIPLSIGIPPFKALRITTGGFIEKSIVYPGLLVFEGILIYNNYVKLLEFVKSLW